MGMKGSRKTKIRISRGYGGKGGGTCGFGNRGQKSRSGGGVRPGFEGGQTPLYRRHPKLKGIAGGQAAGVKKKVAVNLVTLERRFEDDAVVTPKALTDMGVLKLSHKNKKLPIILLATGPFKKRLTLKGISSSKAAKNMIE